MAGRRHELVISGKVYLSTGAAAEIWGVVLMTAFRWATGKVKPPVEGFNFGTYRDTGGNYYIPREVVYDLSDQLIGKKVVDRWLSGESVQMLKDLQKEIGSPYCGLPMQQIMKMFIEQAIAEEHKRVWLKSSCTR